MATKVALALRGAIAQYEARARESRDRANRAGNSITSQYNDGKADAYEAVAIELRKLLS